jgi:DNA-binding XRE family transcriptional regulator
MKKIIDRLYIIFGQQKEIAKALGVTRITFHNWERNRNTPLSKKYLRLVNYVLESGVTKDKLIKILEGKND